jgi:SMODS and SLOG-associating 2TM effector domain 3/SMODS and SLOG-associating 2TM effector domain 1
VVAVDQPAAAKPSAIPGISENEFPALYRAADQNSLTGQRRYLTATGLRLAMLVAAAVFGLVSWRTGGGDLAGIAAAAAFGVALLSELYLLQERPDRVWYDGRAAAESAKTLTWRYLVGGDPFGIVNLSDRDAEQLLLDRFGQIAHDLKGVHLVPVSGGSDQLSDAMRQLRALPLDARRALYRRGRIHDQQIWYARKARWNEQRAMRWSLALTALEAVGLVGAVLKATGTVRVDLLGLAGALVAAGVAWTQTKQHQTLASAYAVASQELATIGARIDRPSTEQEWAHFVDQAEDAISREHTLWRASHT